MVKPTFTVFNCLNCNQKIYRDRYEIKHNKTQRYYCSRKCRGFYQRGINSPCWKGGSITDWGYRKQFINGKWQLEHRLVMEKFIGRKLLKTETVHHINHDKLDNRIENLIIIFANDHSSMHAIERYKTHPNSRGFQ